MKILSFDPSGNFGKEGMGTTGTCVLENGDPVFLGQITAKSYLSEEAYWFTHLDFINAIEPDEIVIEGYKLYNHKGMKANTQANSELQTPQLIGAIKTYCYSKSIPLTVQFASDVKTRWSEKVLVAKGYLEEKNGRYRFMGSQTSTHKRDAMKHALHYWRYGRNK